MYRPPNLLDCTSYRFHPNLEFTVRKKISSRCWQGITWIWLAIIGYNVHIIHPRANMCEYVVVSRRIVRCRHCQDQRLSTQCSCLCLIYSSYKISETLKGIATIYNAPRKTTLDKFIAPSMHRHCGLPTSAFELLTFIRACSAMPSCHSLHSFTLIFKLYFAWCSNCPFGKWCFRSCVSR